MVQNIDNSREKTLVAVVFKIQRCFFCSLRKKSVFIAFDSKRGDIKENFDVIVGGLKYCFMFDSLVITPVGLKSSHENSGIE